MIANLWWCFIGLKLKCIINSKRRTFSHFFFCRSQFHNNKVFQMQSNTTERIHFEKTFISCATEAWWMWNEAWWIFFYNKCLLMFNLQPSEIFINTCLKIHRRFKNCDCSRINIKALESFQILNDAERGKFLTTKNVLITVICFQCESSINCWTDIDYKSKYQPNVKMTCQPKRTKIYIDLFCMKFPYWQLFLVFIGFI